MMTLQPHNLAWINDAADDRADLCAHGDVEFRIDGDVLVDGTNGKGLCVSAAALFLLRTLSAPHNRAQPVGDQLFPCCGFAMYANVGEEDVQIVSCPSGPDFEVEHRPDGAEIVVRQRDGAEAWNVGMSEWRAAVFAFADRVSDFYAAASPKTPADDVDREGFRKFAAEWERRRCRPLLNYSV